MFKILIIFLLICLSKNLIPNWNFTNNTIDIFESSNEYIQTIKKTWYSETLTLTKKYFKNNTSFSQNNIINFLNFSPAKVNFDDIESFYFQNRDLIYICPKGKHNFLIYYKNGIIEEIIYDKVINKNWELKCYHQPNLNLIFVFFLKNGDFCRFNLGFHSFSKCITIDNGIYDFIWTTNKKDNDEYYLIGIVHEGKYVYLKKIIVILKEDTFNINVIKKITLFENLNYIESTFINVLNTNNYFAYWLSYNKEKIISGYYDNQINIDTDFSNEFFILNNTNPFNFIKNPIIQKINFIKDSNIIYYTITVNESFYENNTNNIIYNGIIDIKQNKILFNTNETIYSISEHSNNELLIKTNTSYYILCTTVKKDNKCLSECDSNNYLILDTKSNYCSSNKQCEKYNLLPDNICIETCDKKINILEDNNCYLCKEKDKEKPYKIYGEENNECLKEKPTNTFILYDNLNILQYCFKDCKTCFGEKENNCLSCNENYELNNGKCIEKKIKKCYKECNDCYEESENENEQKCISCNNPSFKLQIDKGNCIKKCLNGYYEENNFCKVCDEKCLNCKESSNNFSSNCISCKNNFLLENDTGNCINECNIHYYKNEIEKKCFKCNENCLSCLKESKNGNNYCLSCNKNSSLKYLLNITGYNNNCVDKCPENSTLINETYCILNNNKSEPIEKEEKNKNFWKYFIVFIILVSFLLLILVIFCIISKKTNDNNLDEDFFKNINGELSSISLE